MGNKLTKTGRCLCGAVTLEAEPFGTSQVCHCATCRQWGGGPYMAVPCKTANFTGEFALYRSSEEGERGFCPVCGTHLFFHPLGREVYGVPLGLFDDGADLPFAAELFIDAKPDTYAFAGERKCLTGDEFRAKFRAQKET